MSSKKNTKPIDQLTVDEVCNTRARKVLFDCLIAGMKVKDAAKEAGLSYGYARKWIAESNVNPLVVREKKAESEDLRDEAIRTLTLIMRDGQAKPATKIKCVDVLGKMSGWHSQTTVLESGSRQRELTEAERQEAQRLALLRFSPQYALPDTHRPMSAQDAQFEAKTEGKADVKQEQSDASQPVLDSLTTCSQPPQVPKNEGIMAVEAPPLPPSDPGSTPSPLHSEIFGENIEGGGLGDILGAENRGEQNG